ASVAGDLPFGGGSGGGVSVKPVGFLVVKNDDVRLLHVNGNQLAERVVDLAPQFMEKVEALVNRRGESSRGESGRGESSRGRSMY
ncbi:MAG: spore germination protein GerW family protein, partial [Ignavibacteriales bacterium]